MPNPLLKPTTYVTVILTFCLHICQVKTYIISCYRYKILFTSNYLYSQKLILILEFDPIDIKKSCCYNNLSKSLFQILSK